MAGPPPFTNANNRVSPSGPKAPGGGGGGDIDGTVGTVDNAVPRADGTGGTTLQGSLLVVDDAGLASGITFNNPSSAQQPATKAYSDAGDAGTLVAAEAYADGKIGGTTGGSDNHVLRSDGTGGKTAQASAMVIDDSGVGSGITFADPTTPQQPATKAYVDAHAGGGIGGTVGTVDNAIPRANGTGGATLQGGLLVVDDAGLASGITFSDPATAQQPATKAYVDNQKTQVTVAAASTQALPAYTVTGGPTYAGKILTANANGAFPVVDGTVTLVANGGVLGRLLLHHAASPVDNEIYDLIQQGSGGQPWILQVFSGTDTAAKVKGSRINVQGGIQQAGNTYEYRAIAAIVEGTTRLFWWLQSRPASRNFITRFIDTDFLWGGVNTNATALVNECGLLTSLVGGTVAVQGTASSARVGVVRLDTGLTATGRASLSQVAASGEGMLVSLDTGLHVDLKFQLPVLSDGTNTSSMMVGLSDSATAAPTNAISVTFQPLVSATDFQLSTPSGGTPANATLGAAVAGQDEHIILHKDPGDANIYAFRAGVLVATAGTAPTGNPIAFIASSLKSAGTSVSGKVDLDAAVGDFYTPLGRGA